MILIIQPEAQAEIDNALDHSSQPVEFRQAIVAMWNLLLGQPEIGSRERGSSFRRFIMQKYPYSAIYFIDGERLIVVAFPHHRQRPNYWKKRLRKP
jgi:toxin ParE1/3/4